MKYTTIRPNIHAFHYNGKLFCLADDMNHQWSRPGYTAKQIWYGCYHAARVSNNYKAKYWSYVSGPLPKRAII